MIGTNAFRVVAAMQHTNAMIAGALWDRAIRKLPRKTMRSENDTTHTDEAIALRSFRTRPQPAVLTLIDLRPKSDALENHAS
jgi:hypothetical protein